MASIKGISLKNVKKYVGMDGFGFGATVYLNNKKVGEYTDDGNGGGGIINYVNKQAEEKVMHIVIEYAKENPNKYLVKLYKEDNNYYLDECNRFKHFYPYIDDNDITYETMSCNDIDYILYAVKELNRMEKIFKKYTKKGYSSIGIKGNDVIAYPQHFSKETIKQESDKCYMSLDDFIIK